MPKEITHWMLAERAFSRLDSGSRLFGMIQSHKNEYLGGAVLPDTLLHLFKGPYAKNALDAADRFHDTDSNSYLPLIHAESRLENNIPAPQFSCILGVISHMIADSVFHPYVYALTGMDDIGRHYQMETDIDVYFLQNNSSWRIKRMKDIITPATENTLVSVAEHLFVPSGELPRQAVSKALSLHMQFQSMYSNVFWKPTAILLGAIFGTPFSQQRHLFYPLFPIQVNNQTLSVLNCEWKHPVSGEIKKETINDLAEEVIRQTVAVFKRIETMQSLGAALCDPPGSNLLTGMFAVKKNNMFKYASI